MDTHTQDEDSEMKKNIEMYDKGMRDALMGVPHQPGNGFSYDFGYKDGMSD